MQHSFGGNIRYHKDIYSEFNHEISLTILELQVHFQLVHHSSTYLVHTNCDGVFVSQLHGVGGARDVPVFDGAADVGWGVEQTIDVG